MEQKVLYYSDELNDELAPATLQPRVIDEKFKSGMHVHYYCKMC